MSPWRSKLKMGALLAAVLAGGALIGFGGASRFLRGPAAIRLEPESLELVEEIVQGEPINSTFQLINPTRRDVEISEISTSCGCMALAGHDGESLATPFTLPAGAKRTVELKVQTTGRRGRQLFSLEARGSSPDMPDVTARAQLTAKVQYPLVSDPPQLNFSEVEPGATLEGVLQLGDLMPDPGVTLSGIRLSHPDEMSADLEPAAGPMQILGTEGGRLRYQVKVSITAQRESGDGFLRRVVTAVPEDRRYEELSVPIVIRFKPRALAISPSRLTFLVKEPSETWNRELTIRASRPEDRPVAVADCPENVQLELNHTTDSEYTVRCIVRAPEPAISQQEVVFSAGKAETPLALPITFFHSAE